jgi:hypothetical protein
MNWEAFFKLLKAHPYLTATGVAAIFAAGISAGSWLLYAEQCHAQAQTNRQVIADLLEYQKQEILRKQIEAEQEQKAKEKIAELCRAKKITDRDECAKAGVTLP